MDKSKFDLHVIDATGNVLVNWESIASKTSDKFVEYVKSNLTYRFNVVDFHSEFDEYGGYLWFKADIGLILQCTYIRGSEIYGSSFLNPHHLSELQKMGWF